MGNYKDLTGQRFGRLTVISRAENHVSKNGNSRTAWICKCECGNELVVMGLNLTRKHTVSCGCARKDGRKKLIVNITGQRFGKLTAIRHVEIDRKGTYWLFRCDCGNEKEMLLQNVKSGKSTSCGKCKHSIQKGIIGKSYDVTGQRFDRLVAVERIVKDNEIVYRCICDCGNECIKTSYSLIYNTRKTGSNSCGCKRNEKVKKASLVGKSFNHLTVLKQADTRYGKLHWLCQCDCGNTTIVSSSGLITGHTKSCGCYQDEVASNTHFNDLSGQRFDMLTVLHRVDNGRLGEVKYLCRCDCGNEKEVMGSNLVSGFTHSCGCTTESTGEKYTERILNELSVRYKTHVSFSDLTGMGNYPLSYDFGIYNDSDELSFLIEYQGIQHYKPVDYFGGEDSFEVQQMHDELKREYANKYMNVPLLEIPYTVRTYQDIKDTIVDFISSLK